MQLTGQRLISDPGGNHSASFPSSTETLEDENEDENQDENEDEETES
jgi:hypothetical protein